MTPLAAPAAVTAVVLAENDRTIVQRVPHPSIAGTAVRKRTRGLHATARIRHERTILHRLAGIGGVPELLPATDDEHDLLMSDVGGISLADAGIIGVEALPRLALRLAEILSGVHRAGVIHRDINPSNILLYGPQRDVLLIDFDVATTFAEVRPGFTHHNEIIGKLPFLAPEQTGRTAQPVDRRSDLYGLGATLYQMATGRPPFGDGDALRLIRDILADVPAPLSAVLPGVPAAFSDAVARLLEKEPDRRYQSATGLVHDLSQIVAGTGPAQLGTRDFPDRLVAPSTLVGRDDEVRALRTALDSALRSSARGVLVCGSGGVGKSALIGQLAPMVTERDGWFVRAKHDQYRQDIALSGMMQALRGLARLLLAESDEQLAEQRRRLAGQLGTNVGLAASLLPEFAMLLGVEPGAEVPDPTRAAAQVRRTVLDILRAVASPQRPVVLVLDDLQWAGDSALRLADAVLTDTELRGVLLVGAYRDGEVDAAHPLTAMQSRWQRLGVVPARLHLTNLGHRQLGTLLAEMLRLPAEQAERLAAVLAERCDGNPYDTVELVNALRRDGALTLTDAGWRWRDADIRRHIGGGDVIDLLAARFDRLPTDTRRQMRVMACLGNEVTVELLAAATGRPAAVVHDQLVPALEDGLLVGDDAESQDAEALVRFRHDRVQQAAFDGSPQARTALRLEIGRRLAATGEFRAEAAEQYLNAAERIDDPTERDTAVALFEDAATRAVRVGNHASGERYLSCAVRLRQLAGESPGVRLEMALHAALYNLGRLDEADAVYARIVEHGNGEQGDATLDLVGPACVQIASLTNRVRPRDALDLGLALLGRLGFAIPRTELRATVSARLDATYQWIDEVHLNRDLTGPELSDPLAHAASLLINRLASPAFFCDHDAMNWLVVQAQQLWAAYGPCAALVAPLAHAIHTTVALREDYATGTRVMRHVLEVSEQRGYASATAHARFLYAVSGRHWSEPLEGTPAMAAAAREGLLSGGDPQHATFAYLPTLSSGLDTGATLDRLATETDAALALAARTGNETAHGRFLTYRQLVRALRGETSARGEFTDDEFDPAIHVKAVARNEMAVAYLHFHQALAAAIFGDDERLEAETRAGGPLIAHLTGIYPTTLGRLLRCLALTRRPAAAVTATDELDAIERWFADRATESPANFAHLHHFVRAERAWAHGDRPAAVLAFDTGLELLDTRTRPWHQALMAERAAALHHQMGTNRIARSLLTEARAGYATWGAVDKVRQLDERYPHLRAGTGAAAASSHGHSLSITADDIDMMAILRASQIISSETSLERVHAAAVEQLRSITGATTVRLLLADGEGWRLLTGPDGADDPLPMTVVRYVERTQQPLTVHDAVRDDRFQRDPYLRTVDRCSLMVVPISAQGAGRTMLVLENRLSAGAFTHDRLDAVMLIAGQLAVSVNNAVLYRTLEQRVADRTAALENANQRLAALSVTDELTGLPNRRRFTNVLAATWAGADSCGDVLAVVMIDIDHFKKFNDRYGHLEGDGCLRAVAQAIHGVIRDSDVVCRYGGEEFVMVLPGAGMAAAAAAAERARAAVAALRIPHAGSDGGVVTISLGVASAALTEAATANGLVTAADAALYEAKRHGRNRVHTSGPSQTR